MTIGEILGAFFGGFGGVAAGFLLMKWLGAKFVETQLAKAIANHQHELDKQLATLEGGMARLGDVLSRRNEREFAVTEQAWALMIEAFGTAQGHFSPGKDVPVFKLKNDARAMKIIAKLPFEDEEKERLRQAGDDERDELYERLELTRGYVLCHKLWAAFKNYVSTHEIFFAQAIYERFIEIRNDLYGVIVHVEMFIGDDAEDFSTKEKMQVNGDLRALDEKVKALAVMIRERFGFSEK